MPQLKTQQQTIDETEVFPISQYIPFTEEQKLRAGAVDLEEFLRQRGEKLIRSGRDKRLASDHSVTVRGSEWYDHTAQRGGGPVSFLQRFYRMSYPEAMQTLLGGDSGRAYPVAREREPEQPKEFALPEANYNMRRVFAYLMKQRHIEKDVISHFARAEMLYEDAEHHNCVFVGRDERGIPRHAHLRSTNSFGNAFRINVEGSDPRYSFHHIGRTGSLFAFEAPIDMMSYITLHPRLWQEHSYVASDFYSRVADSPKTARYAAAWASSDARYCSTFSRVLCMIQLDRNTSVPFSTIPTMNCHSPPTRFT